MYSMSTTLQQLTTSPEAYVRYNAAQFINDPNTEKYRNQMLDDPKIQALITELQSWPGPSISSHRSAQQFFHKLAFLADIGLNLKDPGIKEIVKKVISHRDSNGIPELSTTIAKAFGGTGKEIWAWMMCDAPTTLYSLVKLGYSDKETIKAVKYIADKMQDNGMRCSGSEKLGNWRGPGKKEDPCPYATLITTKLLILFGKKFQKEIDLGAETLLYLWKNSKTLHPFIFYMGTDFRKLKLPMLWYDILHVVDVLSQIPSIAKDKRFLEMWQIISKKAGLSGEYIPESVYQPWKGWDFGQKKKNSDTMCLFIERIRIRMGK